MSKINGYSVSYTVTVSMGLGQSHSALVSCNCGFVISRPYRRDPEGFALDHILTTHPEGAYLDLFGAKRLIYPRRRTKNENN